jgi:hypothetical protein
MTKYSLYYIFGHFFKPLGDFSEKNLVTLDGRSLPGFCRQVKTRNRRAKEQKVGRKNLS